MANVLCSECIADTHLKAIVQSEGQENHCDVCNKDRPSTITVDRLGQLIAAVIKKYFEQGMRRFRHFTFGEYDYLDPEAKYLKDVIQQVLGGQRFDFHDQLVDAVISSEHHDSKMDNLPFSDWRAKYVEKRLIPFGWHNRWESVKSELQTSRRFFNSDAEQLFHDLFHDVESLCCKNLADNDHGVVTNIPQEFEIYRCRICRDNPDSIFQNPSREVGPPPPHKARAGRMNAEGIVILYGSTDKETCLAELRPALGGETAVITLQTTKELRVLDFTRISSAYIGHSYFQRDFKDQRERVSFLQELGFLISQPVAPGYEADYFITQVMIEYLSHVHEKPFDGVLYDSVQCEGGKNIALFAQLQEEAPAFPIAYIEGSLTIQKTTSIKYEHEKVRYDFDGKKAHRLTNFADSLAKFAIEL
ncbi:MAG: RES family NAD+ phosphorylase [Terracidiphilus sp.]